MKLIHEHAPQEYGKDVSFDEQMIGLEFRNEDDIDRQQIDTFWSNIYYASLSNLQRAELASSEMYIVNYKVSPCNYSLEEQKVSVLIEAFLSELGDPATVYRGDIAYVVLDTNGKIALESGSEGSYSRPMRTHVSELLAEAALTYTPLEPESFA